MEPVLHNATPAFVFRADLGDVAGMTFSLSEVWSSLGIIVGGAVVALAGSGSALWFALTGV